MGQAEAGQLVKPGDTGKTVADKNEDIRGYTVRTASGEEIGKVDDLLVVASGGFLGIGRTRRSSPSTP